MIKLIISDFDGVLLDLKQIHYEALNKALLFVGKEFIITPEEHLKTFDGLSTKKKLELLSKTKNFPIEKFNIVNDLKQEFTFDLLKEFTNINYDIASVIGSLLGSGYTFCVASNAIKNTVLTGLELLEIRHLVDRIYSNQDVIHAKPNPEIYLKCMADAGVSPDETLIIEDSKHGRQAAVASGAHVCGVDNSFDFTLDRITSAIKNIESKPIKWAGKSDTTVLIPMAGAGIRFAQAGYTLPKPLIEFNGKPMIQHVIENLNIDANYVFIVQKSLYESHNLGMVLPLMVPGCKVIQTFGLTEGAACTTLLAKEFINNDGHLIIANCDQMVEWDSCQFMYSMIDSQVDGGILTFKASESKWSYAKTDENGNVSEVAEKKVISDNATVGIYYYKRGSDYVKYAEQMIEKNIRTRDEFYVCPVFNEAIQDGKKIKIFAAEKMWGIGTPEDLKIYLDK